DGAQFATRSIMRFVLLARAMEVSKLSVVATSAVRTATDGPAFIDSIQNKCDIDVEVLSGEEEARLASVGLLYGTPDAHGLLCDLGGGSLDMVLLNEGVPRHYGTVPLGHIVLDETSGGKIGKAQKIIDEALDGVPWLSDVKERTLFAVGGSIRALAKLYIRQTGYPIRIVDGFSIQGRALQNFTDLISTQSPQSLKSSPNIPSRRVDTLPMATLVIGSLIQRMRSCDVVFSGLGMREGKMVSMLPKRDQNLDPLIAACEVMGARNGRFSLPGRELYQWISPVFQGDTETHDRCRLAACMLSDLCWDEHPDYRAEHAFERTLRLSVAGMDHAQRVFLALSVFVRYGGDIKDKITKSTRSIIDEDAMQGALITGQALRLGHVLAGSAPGLLALTYLKRTANAVILGSEHEQSLVEGEVVERRLRNLAQTLNLSYEIQT
nr:Ppx/GppA family phosphatase [Alphaproteobacteria bacterium]